MEKTCMNQPIIEMWTVVKGYLIKKQLQSQ